ncbi:MAG: PilZ domain-containing protein [Nitrospiraceae bacterium]
MANQSAAQPEPVVPVASTCEHRRHPRYTVHYNLRYTAKVNGKTIRGGGTLIDVSVEGCGIQGSAAVKQGDRLALEISLRKVTLLLKDVVVMWASGSRFGVKSVECSKLVLQLELLPPQSH